MPIIRWEPSKEVISLKEAIDKLYEESFTRYPTRFFPEMWTRDIPVDIYQAKDNEIVKASLPFVRPGEVDVSITGDILTI
jgi:HSP20 family protein